jgi:ParB-like chromosome segregation protein Spo0J
MTKLLKIAIGELHPDPANVRKHNEKNITAIKASLARFGQQKPIVIDKNRVVRAGND